MARWRISEKIRNRDWWGIAIDLVIVVLGVFLGIQASNWNEVRSDRESGRAYLARIRDDLRSDLRSLDEHERYWLETAEAGQRSLDYAEGGASQDDWAVLSDFFGAGQSWHYSINDATYSELLSAGRLDHIPDVGLRKQLADYYVSQRDQTAFLAGAPSEYRHDIRTVIPHGLQRYLIERCQSTITELSTRSCPRPPGKIDIVALNRTLARNEELIGELRAWMATVAYMRLVGTEQRREATELLAEVDRSLR